MTYQDEIRAISTPDRVPTSIGDLDFFDGVPTTATAELAYDYIDRARGVEVFPAGFEHNWLETIHGKSSLVIFRVYGPEQPWIDKTWRPGEVELVTS